MALRKRFVISMGKTYSKDLEGLFYRAYSGKTRVKPEIPDLRALSYQQGAKMKKNGLVLDWDNDKASVVVKQIKFTSALIVSPATLARLNAERIALIKQLSGLGHRVAVPRYKELETMDNYGGLFRKIKGHAIIFKAKAPIIDKVKIGGAEKNEVDSSAIWARDLWQKVSGKRIMRFTKPGNPFGEGGKSLVLPNKVIIANNSLNCCGLKPAGSGQPSS